MENTCSELLGYCLRGEDWPSSLLARALEMEEGRTFLSVVVERLADLFEPRLCDSYAKLFTQVIGMVCPELAPRTRRPVALPRPPARADRVYVLSRVTLGADVAVTSVLLDAAKRRYPDAEILFVGPRKSYELFENDPRIRHRPAPYQRSGALSERLRASSELWLDDGLVIDPDSRLTQLGLVQVCPEDRYFFFESRSYGSDGHERLPTLAARWADEVFGIGDAAPYVALRPPEPPAAAITVSLGVGGNPAKRIGGGFERELLEMLAATGETVLVDKGDSAEERGRVESALQPGMLTHDGPFAPFAAKIAHSKLYAGYDSAGGHVAAACGVPQICIFAGEASERMFDRWRPLGAVLRGGDPGLLNTIGKTITDTFPR